MRASILLLALVIASACTQKMICPAYQSSFIYDQETLRKKFSYFKEDSTPKLMYTASKNQYLVAVPESYRKKNARLQTVEMKPVFPVIPDSVRLNKGSDDLMSEADVVDSAAVGSTDSVYAITKTKEKYNVDQDIYMWYFRDVLVLPDVRAAMETRTKNRAESAPSPQKKKKGLFGRKQQSDSLAVDDTTVPTDSSAAPPKKKGILGLFGGKKKVKENKPAAKKKDPAKKEDENDGF